MMSITYDFSVFGSPLFPIREIVFVVAASAIISCIFLLTQTIPRMVKFAFSMFVFVACVSLFILPLYVNARENLPTYEKDVFSQLPLSQKINVLEEEISFRLRNNETYRRIFSWDDVIEGKTHVASMSKVELFEAIKSAELSKIKMENYIKKQEQGK